MVDGHALGASCGFDSSLPQAQLRDSLAVSAARIVVNATVGCIRKKSFGISEENRPSI